MKRTVACFVCFIVLLGLTGCYLGDRHSLVTTVSLNLHGSQGGDVRELSTTNAEVQRASKIIDDVFSGDSFVKETRTGMTNAPGFVAAYVRYEAPTLRSGIVPYVYLKDGELEVEIGELGNRTTRPTTLTDKICKSLRKELGNRYGAKNVKIHHE